MIISLQYLIRLVDRDTFRPIEKAKIYLEEARTFGNWKAGGYYAFTKMPLEIDYAEISADGYFSVGRKLVKSEKEKVVYLKKINGFESSLSPLTVTENAAIGSESVMVFADWLSGAELRDCALEECGAVIIGVRDNELLLSAPLSVPLKVGQSLTPKPPKEEGI